MTKEEILKLYLSDLKNLLPDSPAKRSRVIDLKQELEQTESENERLKVESEWISVETELPNLLENVLLWNNERYEEPYKGYLAEPCRWFSMSGTQLFSVTHWMPLPTPPKQ